MEDYDDNINSTPSFLPNAQPPYTIFLDGCMKGKELRCDCGKIMTWLDSNNTLLSDIKNDPVLSEFLMRRYNYDTTKDNTDPIRSYEINDNNYRRRSPSYHSPPRHREYYYSPRHSRSRYDNSHSPSPYYEHSYSHRHRYRRYSRSRSRSTSSHSRRSYYESQPMQIPPLQPAPPSLQAIVIPQQLQQHPQKPLLLLELESKYPDKTMEEVGEEVLVNEVLKYNKRNGLNTDINTIRKQVQNEIIKNQVLLRIEKILEHWKQCSLSKIQSFYEEMYGEKIDSTRYLGYKKLGKCLQNNGFTLKIILDDTIVYPTYRKWF